MKSVTLLINDEAAGEVGKEIAKRSAEVEKWQVAGIESCHMHGVAVLMLRKDGVLDAFALDRLQCLVKKLTDMELELMGDLVPGLVERKEFGGPAPAQDC